MVALNRSVRRPPSGYLDVGGEEQGNGNWPLSEPSRD